jgi:hypothetical protein
MNIVLSLLTSLLSLVFAIVLARRFAHRRVPYYGVWAVGLLWYALSASAEAAAALSHWTPTLFRVWYLAGAIGVAAYLGAGTLYLHRTRAFGSLAVVCILLGGVPALAEGAVGEALYVLATSLAVSIALWRQPRAYPHVAFAALALGSVAAAVVIWTSPVDISVLPKTADQVVTGQAASGDMRVLTPAFNIAGASIVVLGALASGVSFARSRREPRRVVSNGLIAIGAFVPSVTSGLTRFGFTSGFFIGQLIGVTCLLAGFLLATAPQVASRRRESSIPHVPRSPALLPRHHEH